VESGSPSGNAIKSKPLGGSTMRAEPTDHPSAQAEPRNSQAEHAARGLMTPARRAALDALEREFSELLKARPR
jgi:hypothetical protein